MVKIRQPGLWDDDTWNSLNHPVVGVSWYEAEAFCNWLTTVYEQQYRLPTEEEWERLARGQHGREYPWGNKWQVGVSNTRESEVRRTTVVGLFPQGISPTGAYDCAGNVWEWCLDWYDKKEQRVRVLRGGSWGFTAARARCSSRDYFYLPNLGDYNIGFRVVAPIRVSGF
jgi:formylglycine-generating enzyme required for sulfatase activity